MCREKIMKKLVIFVVLTLLFAMTSCTPGLNISVEEDGEINYSFSATLKDVVADTVRSFTGVPESVNLFNDQQIQDSLTESGLQNVSVALPDLLSVKISGSIKASSKKDLQVEDRLPTVPGAIILASEKQAANDIKTLELSLSKKVVSQVLESLPVETVEYLDLLSAPIFTGEEISSLEYVELIGAIYGATVAKALEESFVEINVSVPSSVRKAEALFPNCNTNISGKSVEFVMPLADFLTQNQEVSFVVQY